MVTQTAKALYTADLGVYKVESDQFIVFFNNFIISLIFFNLSDIILTMNPSRLHCVHPGLECREPFHGTVPCNDAVLSMVPSSAWCCTMVPSSAFMVPYNEAYSACCRRKMSSSVFCRTMAVLGMVPSYNSVHGMVPSTDAVQCHLLVPSTSTVYWCCLLVQS